MDINLNDVYTTYIANSNQKQVALLNQIKLDQINNSLVRRMKENEAKKPQTLIQKFVEYFKIFKI